MKKIIIAFIGLFFAKYALSSQYVPCTISETENGTCFDCGTKCVARYTQTVNDDGTLKGTLTVSGEGYMDDYDVSRHPNEERAQTQASWKDLDRQITNLVIEEGIEHIGNFAFYYSPIKDVKIPSSLKSIGSQTFDTSSLRSITLPNTIEEIGNGAFRYSVSLEEVIIGEGVSLIGDNAFEYCSKLKNIIIGDNVTSIGANAFLNIASDAVIYCQNTQKHDCNDLVSESTMGSDKLVIYTINNDGKIVVGNKAYASLNDLVKGTYIPKRIYTIEEANAVAGKVNSVKIRYR